MKRFEKVLATINDGRRAARITGTRKELGQARRALRKLAGAQVRAAKRGNILWVWAAIQRSST